MGAREGAKSLGLGDEIGTLETGKRADITIIDMTALHLTPSYDAYSSLAYSVGRVFSLIHSKNITSAELIKLMVLSLGIIYSRPTL